MTVAPRRAAASIQSFVNCTPAARTALSATEKSLRMPVPLMTTPRACAWRLMRLMNASVGTLGYSGKKYPVMSIASRFCRAQKSQTPNRSIPLLGSFLFSFSCSRKE